jgi:hypothetical protein
MHLGSDTVSPFLSVGIYGGGFAHAGAGRKKF